MHNKIEFDLYMATTVGLTTGLPKTVSVMSQRVQATGVVSGSICFISLIVRESGVTLRGTTVSGGGLVSNIDIGTLDPATKTTIRVENIQGTAIYNGTCLFYVNDVYAGGIFDLDYTGFYSNPQSVALGIVSNNVGAFDLYASNLVIDTFEVLDYTERYNGTFTSNDGKTVTVVNGIITAAV